MTPTPPSPADKRTSGNPAKQAEINLTVKQQREQKRQEKLAEYQKQLAKRRRSKLVWWVVGITAAVVIIGLIVASIVFAPEPPKAYTPGGEGVEIEGVETYENATQHVEGTVDYEQSPPAGGPHNAVWLNCGIYDQQVPNENAVHAMEHGAVWVAYQDTLPKDQVTALTKAMPDTYAVLYPYKDLPSPVVASAWGRQLKLDSATDPRPAAFIREFRQGSQTPEPGASCTGGVDGTGKP